MLSRALTLSAGQLIVAVLIALCFALLAYAIGWADGRDETVYQVRKKAAENGIDPYWVCPWGHRE